MLHLPRIQDPRGNLSFIQSGPGGACPFEIDSVGWCYDIPGGLDAGNMSLAGRSSMAVALSGSFSVGKSALLNRSDRAIVAERNEGLYLSDFATNSVGMVIHSTPARDSLLPEDAPLISAAEAHRLSDVGLARIISLPRIPIDGGGSLTSVANGMNAIPFNIRRIFYLYDVPADAARGGHSHYVARELIVAMSGSFDVVLDDGKTPPRRFTLNRPYHALYVPAGLWRTLDNFSGGAVSAVLTSHRFSEADYVRDYDRFLALCRNHSSI